MHKLFAFKHYATIMAQIGTLQPGVPIIPFFTHGLWNSTQTLLYVLSHTGPATVTATSFSISDSAITYLLAAKQAGYITNLSLILHSQMRNHRQNIIPYAKNVANTVHLYPIHHKIFLVEADGWQVAINGSANLTDNPAEESGTISTCPQIFAKYSQHLQNIIKNAQAL